MSKKSKPRKPKHHGDSTQNLREVRTEKLKIGKVHIAILIVMIIAALVFVLPRMS